MGLDMYINDDNDSQIAYWRKFNALHNWFVKYVQDGVDECQRSRPLTKQDIERIIYVLEAVNKDPVVGKELLPTSSGFFFGDTGYGEYYMEDVRESIPVFKKLLDIVEKKNIYYQASW